MLSSKEAHVVCIHKGLVDDFSVRFVEELLETHSLVFANAVFCIYSLQNKKSDHIKSTYENESFNFQKWLEGRKKSYRKHKHLSEIKLQERRVSNILIVTANNFGNAGDDANHGV